MNRMLTGPSLSLTIHIHPHPTPLLYTPWAPKGPRSGPGPSRLRRVLVTELNEDTSSEVNRVCLSSFPLTLLPALFPFTRLRLTHSHPILSLSRKGGPLSTSDHGTKLG